VWGQRLVQGVRNLPAETKWLWGFLIFLLAFLLEYATDLKSPSETSWFKSIASGERPTFKTYLAVGLWYGTWIHVVLVAALVLTVRWWGTSKPARHDVGLGTHQNMNPRWFWILLAVICVASGVVRWPKMSLSYWGDEGWAVAPYVYGKQVPVDPGQPQGEMVLKPVSWLNTAFDDRTCGNHYLFSLSQRATLEMWRTLSGPPPDAFDETISRLPPFAAGIASLAALALMLRWLGRPGAGLASALMLSLHPWHFRYSTEARGYTMMLFFLIAACWFAFIALKHGRWRWWLLFGLAEFLCMYSWKGVMYPLAAANIILMLWIWLGKRLPSDNADGNRSATFARFLVANILAAGLFINLVYPCLLQVKDAKAHLVQLSGRPMDRVWMDNAIYGVFTGMFWHVEDKENPTEVVGAHQMRLHPVRTRVNFIAYAALLGIGLVSLARRNAWHTAIQLAMLAAGVVGAVCFRLLIGAEWLYWYFFFVTLPLAMLGGFGIDALTTRLRAAWLACRQPSSQAHVFASVPVLGALCLGLPGAYADLGLPAVRLMSTQPYENHRGAFQATRGRHEPLHFTGPSNVHTLYLWRYISLYDPRGDTHVRKMDAMRERIAQVEKDKGELYVVIGHRRMARGLNPALMDFITKSGAFEHLTTFWAPEELHSLHCYRYRHAAYPSETPLVEAGPR
jgi:hypothetical protein